ncbi:MAG: hypothetical protein CM15mV22_0360 [Eurybiavirus sp.]|nr:MAG: hypothetical protein CM15mV22_0360 [Eurybiavirus sp.]
MKQTFLTHLREYERIANGQIGKPSVCVPFALWNQYPVGSQAIINEWIGFRTHHERQKAAKN